MNKLQMRNFFFQNKSIPNYFKWIKVLLNMANIKYLSSQSIHSSNQLIEISSHTDHIIKDQPNKHWRSILIQDLQLLSRIVEKYSYQGKITLSFSLHFPVKAIHDYSWWLQHKFKKHGSEHLRVTNQASIRILASVWSTSISKQRVSIPSGLSRILKKKNKKEKSIRDVTAMDEETN